MAGIPSCVMSLAAGMPFPKIAGSYDGPLLIVGSGRCVWDDLAGWNDDIDTLCVNAMISHFPNRVTHGYSNHADKTSHFITARCEKLKKRDPNAIHSHSFQHNRAGSKWSWPWPGHGSSGMSAVLTGIGLGYTKILVAGMPLDNTGHFYDPPVDHALHGGKGPPSNFLNEADDVHWQNMCNRVFQNCNVKFFSGRAAKWLGTP